MSVLRNACKHCNVHHFGLDLIRHQGTPFTSGSLLGRPTRHVNSLRVIRLRISTIRVMRIRMVSLRVLWQTFGITTSNDVGKTTVFGHLEPSVRFYNGRGLVTGTSSHAPSGLLIVSKVVGLLPMSFYHVRGVTSVTRHFPGNFFNVSYTQCLTMSIKRSRATRTCFASTWATGLSSFRDLRLSARLQVLFSSTQLDEHPSLRFDTK